MQLVLQADFSAAYFSETREATEKFKEMEKVTRINSSFHLINYIDERGSGVCEIAELFRDNLVHSQDYGLKYLTEDKRGSEEAHNRDRLRVLESQMESLNALPNNRELLDKMFPPTATKAAPDSQTNQDQRRVSELWQTVQMKRRVDATEEGLSRLSSLTDDLLSQIKRLSEENKILSAALDEAKKGADLNEKFLNLENKLLELEKRQMQDANLFKNVVHMDALCGLVFWHSLGAALSGIDYITAYANATDKLATSDKIAENGKSDRGIVDKWPENKLACPDPDLSSTLRKLGTVASGFDNVLQRIDRLEATLHERDTLANEVERNSVKSSRVLDDLTVEKKGICCLRSIDCRQPSDTYGITKYVNPSKLVGEFPSDPKRVELIGQKADRLELENLGVPPELLDRLAQLEGTVKELAKEREKRMRSVSDNDGQSFLAEDGSTIPVALQEGEENEEDSEEAKESRMMKNKKLIKSMQDTLAVLQKQISQMHQLITATQDEMKTVREQFADLQQFAEDLDTRKVDANHVDSELLKRTTSPTPDEVTGKSPGDQMLCIKTDLWMYNTETKILG
ncbi:unnamed protein product [Echinostoma caproni]|uniref:Protein CASP n=1 Tax=Echinostoma caproni TaxID=27848 RepID=A0A183A5V2_9TREM|nr:unnamed protein product [Echinostoma caproni]